MSSLRDNAPLSKKEQEEEEMRQELKEVGLYYESMTVNDMKQYINVLNESKNDSRARNEGISSSSYSEIQSTEDISKATENVTARPMPSFSYILSGKLQDNTPEEVQNSNDNNLPASSSNLYDKNSIPSSPENESIYDRTQTKKEEDYPAITSRYETRSRNTDGPKTRFQDKKSSIPAAKRASMERWMLHPSQFVQDENATPLSKPQHVKSDLEDPLSYNSETVDLESKEFDQLCQQMEERLNTFNKQCFAEFDANKKMAGPIKVNFADIPAGKSSVKEKSLPISSPGSNTTSNRNSYDRATKRKALSTIAAATDFFDKDDGSDDEFSNTKKRKFQQGKKGDEEAGKKNQESKKNKNASSSIETINIDDSKDGLDNFDNSDFHSIRKNSNKKVSSDNGSDEGQTQYPRRITPPNPGKKNNFKGPRAKKNNSTLIEEKPILEKRKSFLNDEDIGKELDADGQIEDSDIVEITDDIKPPPILRKVGKKLSVAANLLEQARALDEQKAKEEEEAKERRANEERLKKDELISSRMQELENKEFHEAEKQRKCDIQTDFYKNLMGSKSRVTRSSFQKAQTDEEINEDLLLRGNDDDELTVTRIIEKQLCPICQQSFPAGEIQTHASGCDAYATESKDTYDRPSTSRRYNVVHTCAICDRFSSDDGNIFEEHVIHCKNRSRDSMNGRWTTN